MAEEIDVGMKCIKYMLFVANFMFVMIGFLLISIGSTIKAIYGDFELFMASHYFSPAILAIVIGVVIFFVAIFGCVGAVKESTCLINLFGFFLTLLLILEVAAAIAAYAMRGQIESTIRDKMSQSIGEYNHDPYDRDVWDFTQRRLDCCGIDGAGDWDKYILSGLPDPGIIKVENPAETTTPGPSTVPSRTTSDAFLPWGGPTSCCRSRDVHEGQCVKRYVFKDGCLDALTYVVSESALLLGCGALAVAFIQLLGIIFAWMLAKAIRRLKTQQLLERDESRQRSYEQLGRNKEENNQTPVLYTPTFSEA